MFAVPDIKRVKRDNLHGHLSDPSTASSPSPELDSTPYLATLRRQFEDAFEEPIASTENADESADVNKYNEDDGLEFRLFRSDPKRHVAGISPNCQSASVARIQLQSPIPQDGERGGFVDPLRPHSYYFVPSADSSERREKRKEYKTVAIDGKDVILRARNTAWPGTHLPFRTMKLPPSSLAPVLRTSLTPVPLSQGKSKSRPGKKRRRTLHMRLAEEAAKREARKEKHTAMNRKKKVRRKEKEKARKRAAAGL